MRDYLYLWHQSLAQRLVASGIEFRDVVPQLETSGGIILLRHQFEEASFDPVSGFEFVPADQLARLTEDDIYGYGDFCWADFGHDVALADLTDQAIAELTFFGHKTRPFGRVDVPGLSNRFLYYAHDDGWHARIFYIHWEAIRPMLRRLILSVLDEEQAMRTFDLIRSGEAAVWCSGAMAVECRATEDIDALQQEHLTSG